jgi:large subunit ribosomal protein L21
MGKNNKYAVVRLKGTQHKVVEGQELLVDKVDPKEIEAEVLLSVDDGKVKIGKPTVKSAEVKFKVVNEEEKGEKVDIFKYKSKSRYRKHMGFRPKYTRLLVEKITS